MRPAANETERKTAVRAVFALAAVIAGAGLISAQPGPLVARVASVTGSALILPANSASSLALSAGLGLNPGDRLDTRAGGRVVIDLSDGSIVVVEPQSLLVLKDFRQAASLRELFEIFLGAVRVKITSADGPILIA